MFIAEINDVEHKIFFKHTKEPGEHPTATKCIIVNKDTNDTVAEAYARCNPVDRFEYATGRKIALQRALEEAGFNREQRKTAWAAYTSN